MFYSIPVTEYKRVLEMPAKVFLAMLDHKNKVLKGEVEEMKKWRQMNK